MEVKQEVFTEKRVKRTAVDMSKLKADGLMVAAGSDSNKKKRRGFSSTQTSTIASGGDGGRNTLG
jgi:hypothetical protein